MFALACDFLQVPRQLVRREFAHRVDRGKIRQFALAVEAHQGSECIERDEVRRMREQLIVVSQARQHRHRDIRFEEIFGFFFPVIRRTYRGFRTRHIAVPFMDLGEELHEIGLRLIRAARRTDEDAGCERAHKAHHFRILTDRGRLILGTD